MKKLALIVVNDGKFVVEYKQTMEEADAAMSERFKELYSDNDVLCVEQTDDNQVILMFEDNTFATIAIKYVEPNMSILLWNEDDKTITKQVYSISGEMKNDFEYYKSTFHSIEQIADYSFRGFDNKEKMHGIFAVVE